MAERIAGHQTSDIDFHPPGGFFTAICTCGWIEGPFPDLETMIDALMWHAANATLTEYGR